MLPTVVTYACTTAASSVQYSSREGTMSIDFSTIFRPFLYFSSAFFVGFSAFWFMPCGTHVTIIVETFELQQSLNITDSTAVHSSAHEYAGEAATPRTRCSLASCALDDRRLAIAVPPPQALLHAHF